MRKSDKTLLNIVRTHYKSKEQLQKYKSRSKNGLLVWEKIIARKYFAVPGRLLDIGCGSGREAFALSQMGHKITGIDISEEEIQIANQLSKKLNENIDFRTTDGICLNFATDHFDYITLWSQVIGNIPRSHNRLAFLKECFRVLRLNGIISVSFHNKEICELQAKKLGIIQSSKTFKLEEGDFIEKESDFDTPCYWHYFTKPEIEEVMQNSGFEVLECKLVSELEQGGWNEIIVAVGKKYI
jgi:SAM-dependent methyltransferase